jgi:hypothetical protein
VVLRVRHADIEIEYQLTRMQLGAERLVTSSRHQIATIAAALLRHRQTAGAIATVRAWAWTSCPANAGFAPSARARAIIDRDQ